MEKLEDLEWIEAQKMVINIDLIAATKKHLQFLEAINDNGKLYNGLVLERAVFRYKYCWLPLLAKHKVTKWQLVVPLDCEWIWHCHRLNPVRYMADCKELFGRILDPCGMVISSIEGGCKKETEELWNKMYPKEPYELGLLGDCFDNEYGNELVASESTKYDLVSAVKRQRSFYYQVSRAFMKDDIFLDGALKRYKGFLHLIRRNMEKKSGQLCVPTYDIDLIWHTHQLHPLSYCNDTVSLLGNILDHDDSDSDRAKDQKLDVGFTRTTKQWTHMFSSRYWRAGAMYSDITPLNHLNDSARSSVIMFVEIMVEMIEVRNYHKGNLVLSIKKKQNDMLFKGNNHFNICAKTEEPQAVIFQCEPNGDLFFQLMDGSSKSLGTCLISISELDSKLASPIWLKFESDRSLSVTLGIFISMTPPSPLQGIVIKCGKLSGSGGCGTTCITTRLWATGGMCNGSGGGGGCGSGCRASCGGCHGSCGGRCGGGGNCNGKQGV
ncbi:hypothetical protein L6452_05977 [Arctium lappa]|uniref:Uncharacterized protein n=1 Tax=Arctium lappa TaxID=4217 RepID=A0ACB9EI69_ARCLA|nr:hypothetical protein L6452_05977 [Arctium lappa]